MKSELPVGIKSAEMRRVYSTKEEDDVTALWGDQEGTPLDCMIEAGETPKSYGYSKEECIREFKDITEFLEKRTPTTEEMENWYKKEYPISKRIKLKLKRWWETP